MPAAAEASPAVVMVCTPSMKESFSSGIGSGLQRCGAGGSSISAHGAVRQKRASIGSNRPQFPTVGRMRYSHERLLLARGAVKGEPLSCSA